MLAATVSPPTSTARSVTMPKRSSERSHSVSVAIDRVSSPAIRIAPSSASEAPVIKFDEQLRLAGVEPRDREPIAGRHGQLRQAQRLRTGESLHDAGHLDERRAG